MTKDTTAKAPKEPKVSKEPKAYPALSGTFLKGNLPGQVNSVYKDRLAKPDKVADFKKAVREGHVHLGHSPLSKNLITKLTELGISVPAALHPPATS